MQVPKDETSELDRGGKAYLVRSVVKAFSILELFGDERKTLSAAEITQLTGENRATSYRFCQTLVALGYLEQMPNSQYRMGYKSLRLAHAAIAGQELPEIARPILEALRDQTGETVNMAVRDAGEIVYVVRLKTSQILNIGLSVGSRLPLHATSLGKAILAFLPKDEQERIIDSIQLDRLTENTVQRKSELSRQLSVIRELGFSLNLEELSLGLRGVAAPILDVAGYPVAAINIALTRPASSEELESTLAPLVVKAADEISERAWHADLPGGPAERRTSSTKEVSG
jgi:IclR family pca regulon transcriptional regulator